MCLPSVRQPVVTFVPLQRVVHAEVRLVANLGFRHLLTGADESFTLATDHIQATDQVQAAPPGVHPAVNRRSPNYITETLLVPTSSLYKRARPRSSTSGTSDVPRVRTQSAIVHVRYF